MTAAPSNLTSAERNEMQEIHGVCWNTEDTFDQDNPDHREIMEYHRAADRGHWYLPYHESLRYEAFETETAAYAAAARIDRRLS